MKKLALVLLFTVFVLSKFPHEQRQVFAQTEQEIFDYWSDEVYRIYKDTDLQGVIENIDRKHIEGVNAARSLAGQAMMHSYYYHRDRNSRDLTKAKHYINAVINTYPSWKGIWGSAVTMNQLAFDVWWLWPELEPETRAKFFDILTEEADFWTWVLNEIRSNPMGNTIPEEAGKRSGQNNLSLITTDLGSDDHLDDTRAEENGWNAQFLATAYSIFPQHPQAEKWNEAAECFAFHTFSQGETACGITSRTISDDYTLGNHNLWPSPLYTLSGITSLQQGQLSYFLADKTPPAGFFHHLESRIDSPVWVKNVAECMNEKYEITPECHAGEDWGDKNLRPATFILSYWAELQNDNNAEELLEQMLNYFYSIEAPIRYPHENPISGIDSYTQSGESLQWLLNLERHPQLSIKNFAVENYQDLIFRQTHFVINPKVCEEDIFKEKIWTGELDWQCDSQVKNEGEASIKLTSDLPSNAERYSPLIKIEPNQAYKVSYLVKTDNLQPDDAGVYGRVVAAQYDSSVQESDAVNQNRIDAGFTLGENVQGTNDWTRKEYTFVTNPNAEYVRLRAPMGLQGRTSGTVWFDDVKIEKITLTPKTLLSRYGTGDGEADLNGDGLVNGMDFGEMVKLVQQ